MTRDERRKDFDELHGVRPTIDPAKLSETDYLRWERIGWLRAVIADFRELRRRCDEAEEIDDVPDDDDPDATAEALRECEALAAELEAELKS